MKGHVKLELRNANGETKVVHQDNLITNAVPMNIANSITLNSSGVTSSIYNVFTDLKNAFGCILLFDDNLSEDKNNISFPTDCNLLGIGSITNDSKYKYLATFVSSESKYDENGIKMVWDFNSSQANGVIKSIALTNRDAFLNILNTTNISNNEFITISNAWKVFENYTFNAMMPFYFVDDSCYVYQNYDKGIYKIDSNIDGSIKPHTRYNSTLVKTLNINKKVLDIADGFDGYAYVLHPDSIKRYKISDLSFDEDTNFQLNITIENTSYWTNEYSRIIICDGMAYLFYRSDCYYKINLETMEQEKIQLSSMINGIVNLDNNHVYFYYSDASSPYPIYKLDLKTGTISKTCIPCPNGFRKGLNKRLNKSGLSLVTYYSADAIYVGIHRNYLGTICNLKTPIEKTADQTLRVTYTLTDINT